MSHLVPLLALLLVGLVCAYRRTTLLAWTVASTVALALAVALSGAHWLADAITIAVYAAIALPPITEPVDTIALNGNAP